MGVPRSDGYFGKCDPKNKKNYRSRCSAILETNSENILITRERHRQNLINCVHHLEKFQKKKSIQDFDKAAEDLRLATRYLGMIVGKVDVEELLGSIFKDFCIGK